jgi:hypothetical protein
MADGFAAFAGRAAPWLLTYLLHSTVLVIAAWLLERSGLVRGARTLDLLWKTALLAGFATSALSLARASMGGRREAREVRAVVRRDVPGPGPRWSPDGAPGTLRIEGRVVARPSARCEALLRDPSLLREGGVGAVRAACAAGGAPGWPEALVLLWIAGAAALGLDGYRGRRRLAAVLAPGDPPGPRVAEAAARLGAPEAGRVEVVVSRSVSTPCAVGRRVLLPPRCEAELGDGELRAALAHELSHVTRRDPAWLSVADAVCRLAWIQPLNRVGAASLRDVAELACDEGALRHVRPLDLARCLHRIAGWALPGCGAEPAAGLTRRGSSSLGRRVRRILARDADRPPRSTWVGAAWMGALVAGALLLPSVPVAREVRAVFVARTAPSAGPGRAEPPTTVHVFVREVRAADAEPVPGAH